MIDFIRPIDLMMFAAPRGIDFRSLRDSSGSQIKDTIDKLKLLKEFRNDELMKTINKQYDGVSLVASNRLKVNSVVLLRHINTETKREPLRLARVSEKHTSRDGSQRVVVVTYHNIHQNRRGEWVGNS